MLAILDERVPKAIKRTLQEHGLTPLCMPPHPALPTPIASHPDMLLFFANDRILCTKEYQQIASKELDIISKHAQKPITIVEASVEAVYPKDILLNAASIGDKLLCNRAHTAKELISDPFFTEIIDVKQGYAKCSTVPVGNNALITSDPSIAKAAEKSGIDVLKIRQAHIELTGYDTGFLGGAASYAPYCQMDTIYFCGNLNAHPDANAIHDFCTARKIKTISLTESPLVDLGTVFLI